MQGIMICKNHLCGLLLNSKLASKVFNSIVKCLATIIYVKSNYFEQHIKNIKYILNNLLLIIYYYSGLLPWITFSSVQLIIFYT